MANKKGPRDETNAGRAKARGHAAGAGSGKWISRDARTGKFIEVRIADPAVRPKDVSVRAIREAFVDPDRKR